jgi:hypothetical protein
MTSHRAAPQPNRKRKRRSFTFDGSELTTALRCVHMGLAVVPMHTVRSKRCTCPQMLKADIPHSQNSVFVIFGGR